MAKMRVYELSRELNVSSKDIISVLTENGVDVKSASSNVEDDAIRLVRSRFAKGGALKAEPADNSVQKDDSTAADKASKESSSAEISANGESEDEGDKKLKKRRRPKKKKNITAVFNMQYSKNQKGASSKEASGSRSAQDRRRREDNRRGAFRPAGGASHIIRPRPESERTVRPKATRQRPEEPMLKKDYMPAPKAEEPKAPVKPPVKKEVQKPAEAAPEVKAAQKPKETKAEPKNTAPVRSGDSSDIKSENRNIRSTSDNHGSGRGNQGAKPQSGGQRNTAKSGGRQNGGSSQQQQQGGRGGRNQKFSKPAKQGDQKNRNAKGNAQGRDNRPNSKHKNKDRDALGKKKEHYVNLEKKTAKKRGKNQNKQEQRNPDEILTLTLPEHLTIRELADKMKIQPSTIVKSLFMKGTMATVNQDIDYETAEEIALEFNCVCEPEEKVDVIAELLKEEEEDPKTMTRRPPVVCVMGHVDHGKTSLLDAIRDTRVTAREAGGITQKIGAYVVDIDDRNITFLDTPGHEAFTAMRMRGANSTDIAILVVAADDGVMPQTIEAINHAKAADIEIIVAINKIDKPNANIERVKQELSEYQLIPEDWGGSTMFVPVSAHTHEGIDELLEMILLTADVMELSANPKRNARGLVIEAELDKGRGAVATVLVQKGTLKVGDPVAAGSSFGRVRAMIDDNGKNVKKAGPSMPVEILGLSEVPNAGEIFVAMDSEKEARSFANTFVTESKNRMVEDSRMKMSLDDLFSKIQAGNLKELDIIVKADVQGSVEAVRQSLEKLSNDEVIVKVIHGGVGSITESDVTLASASNAIIIGFNVRPDPISKQTAESEGVDIRLYKVIYNAIEDVEAAMKGMLEPVYEEKVIGHAEVRQIFKSSDVGNIAGSYILDGHFERNCKTRVFRGDEQIFEGSLASLKRFKDDVKEVKSGYECGIVLDGFSDFVEEDRIEAYIMVEVPR